MTGTRLRAPRMVTGLAIAGLLAASISSSVSANAMTAGSAPRDWPSINFDYANTSNDTSERVLTTSTLATLHPVAHSSNRASNGPIVVAHGKVFGTCAVPDNQDVGICAWSATSFRLQWRRTIHAVPDETNIAASGGAVVVHVDGGVYEAFRQSSGATLWRLTDPDGELTTNIPPPIVTSTRVIYVDDSWRVVQRSLATGKQVSRVPAVKLPRTLAYNRLLAELAGLTVVGATAYVLQDDSVVAVPLGCPAACGPREAPGFAYPTGMHLAYSGGRLYANGLHNGPGVRVFSARTGAPLFTLTMNDAGTNATADVETIAIASDVVFASDDSGVIDAWSTAGCGKPTCAPLWHTTTGAARIAPEFVESAGRLFTSGNYILAAGGSRRG